MNIPDEAVEAAAFELYKDDWWGKPTAWPDPPFADDATLEDYKADYLKTARAALEAAAPFMRQAFFLESNLKAIAEELATPFNFRHRPTNG